MVDDAHDPTRGCRRLEGFPRGSPGAQGPAQAARAQPGRRRRRQALLVEPVRRDGPQANRGKRSEHSGEQEGFVAPQRLRQRHPRVVRGHDPVLAPQEHGPPAGHRPLCRRDRGLSENHSGRREGLPAAHDRFRGLRHQCAHRGVRPCRAVFRHAARRAAAPDSPGRRRRLVRVAAHGRGLAGAQLRGAAAQALDARAQGGTFTGSRSRRHPDGGHSTAVAGCGALGGDGRCVSRGTGRWLQCRGGPISDLLGVVALGQSLDQDRSRAVVQWVRPILEGGLAVPRGVPFRLRILVQLRRVEP